MSKLFNLNGIKAPGRVNLMKFGTINLEDISDDDAIELYKSGCPFLVPVPEAIPILYPDQAPIKVEDIEIKEEKIPQPKKRGKKR